MSHPASSPGKSPTESRDCSRRDAQPARVPAARRRARSSLAAQPPGPARCCCPRRAGAAAGDPDLYLAGTDGWIYLPPTPAIPPFHPDILAPDPFTTYIFGFRNVTGLTTTQKVEPEEQGAALRAAVLGEPVRPGPPGRLHGPADQPGPGAAARPVRRAHPALARLPQRDPVLRRRADRLGRGADRAQLHLRLPAPRPRHVHVPLPRRGRGARAHGHDRAGVRPPAAGRATRSSTRAASTCTTTATARPGSTASSRCSCREVWAEAHWADAHIQLPEWSDYRADFSLLNGRVYPDTIAPNGSIDPFHPVARRRAAT